MRVVINQQVALGPKTGIGHYTVELLRCLRAQAGDDRIDAFPDGWMKRAREIAGKLRSDAAPKGEKSKGQKPASGWKLRLLRRMRDWDQAIASWHLRALHKKRKYDLYHEPNVIPLPCDLPVVVTVHDLSVALYPEWHPADRVANFEKEFHRGVNRCAHLLTDSDFSRRQLIETLGLPPERVTRTYPGVRAGLTPLSPDAVAPVLKRLGLPPRYLLYVGTIEPRKNVLRLLQTYCALPESLRSRWPLLLVGRWGWRSGEVADYFMSKARHRGVIHQGYVADEHLPAIYNSARALIFPSYYEGFGLPPVEMMACGGAVLASTAGAVKEVVGSHAHLVDPEDTGGWLDALVRILKDDDWQRTLRQGVVEAAQRYSWENCAADTLRVYRSLCNQTPARRAA